MDVIGQAMKTIDGTTLSSPIMPSTGHRCEPTMVVSWIFHAAAAKSRHGIWVAVEYVTLRPIR